MLSANKLLKMFFGNIYIWKLVKSKFKLKTFHNLKSDLAWRQTKILTLIRHTICESLVEMQLFRHELLSIMHENTKKKRNEITGLFITYSYMWHMNTSKCVYKLDTHSVKFWWSYVLPNTNAVQFCNIFSDIGLYFWLAQTKNK